MSRSYQIFLAVITGNAEPILVHQGEVWARSRRSACRKFQRFGKGPFVAVPTSAWGSP